MSKLQEKSSRAIRQGFETVIKIFQQTKVLDQMASQANFTKHLEKS